MDTVFCKQKYVSNIQDSDNTLSFNTNGGLIKLHQKCDIPYINDVWYNKNRITNIISMKDMTDKFRITMDLEEELALLVHMSNNIVGFNPFSNCLYAMEPNDENSYVLTKEEYQFMNTLEENMKFLSPR